MVTNKNSAYVTGTAVSPYYRAHATWDGPCYKVFVAIRRLSGEEDTIPVIVPESCLEDTLDPTGRQVEAKGSFQSRSRHSGVKHHLDLFVYADQFTLAGCSADMDGGAADGGQADAGQDAAKGGRDGRGTGAAAAGDTNVICMEGYITKEPTVRRTPLGREIADIIIAVNGPDPRHPNYIPCIAWGRNSILAGTLQPGDFVRIEGRAQSREYSKTVRREDGEAEGVEKRVAYEVSCSKLEVLERGACRKKEEQAGQGAGDAQGSSPREEEG